MNTKEKELPTPLSLEDGLRQLGEPDSLEVLQPHWGESQSALAAPVPSFLDPAVAVARGAWCGLPAEAGPLLAEACTRVQQNPALVQLAWHCHQLLYEHTDYNQVGKWPKLTAALGEASSLFYLLIALAMVPRVQAVHRTMGVPEEVTQDTCRQIACFAGNYRGMSDGRLGIPLNQLYGLRHYTAGRRFRIGRFEYMIRPFRGGVEVFRHNETGQVLALAPDGVRYNQAGYVTDETDPAGWAADLRAADGVITGYPISPEGMALRRPVSLPLTAWESVLKNGDPVLEMHIPAGGGMTPAECGDSLRQAAPFFRRYLPHEPFGAITCSSWIFNTQLQERLSSDNQARFQRDFIFSGPLQRPDGLCSFSAGPFDPATAPRGTACSAVADFITAGNTGAAGKFFLVEH